MSHLSRHVLHDNRQGCIIFAGYNFKHFNHNR